MLEGAAATVGARSGLWGRALATSLGRLAAGSFARRAGDLPQRRGDNRRPFALRRGWRQAVVRSLAAFKAQGGSDGSVIGAIVQGAAPAIRERWGPQRRPRLQRFRRRRASPC